MPIKKPRIIITMHYMELGGAETSLLGLLEALDPARVDVDLFIYAHRGPLMAYIPQYVNVLPEDPEYSAIETPIIDAVAGAHFRVAAARVLAKLRHAASQLGNNTEVDDHTIFQYVADSVTPVLPSVNTDVEYDLCISYCAPHNVARDKVRARKRLAWIHTDYSSVHIHPAQELPVWSAFDAIVAISDDVRHAFAHRFPSLTDKLILVENILPVRYIRQHANNGKAPEIHPGHINLLTIGRFINPKNFDNIPDIAARMVSAGLDNLRWYIIGYGPDEALLHQKIAESAMENHIVVLGKRKNPYPYLAACTLYVQPSRYEGKSIAVREAQTLGRPVAVTAYPTAGSQVHDGVDGVIVPMDNAGCAEALTALLRNRQLLKSIADYVQAHNFDASSEVDKIYSLLP